MNVIWRKHRFWKRWMAWHATIVSAFGKPRRFRNIVFLVLLLLCVCSIVGGDAQIRPRIEKHPGGLIIDLFIIFPFCFVFCFQQSFKLQVNNITYMGHVELASKRAKTNSTHLSQTGIFLNLFSASLNCFMFLLQFVLTNLRPFLSFSKALKKPN